MLFDGFDMQRRQREQCTMLRSAILDLMDWRLQLMTGTFTLDHLRDLRMRITSHIDSGNRYVTFFVIFTHVLFFLPTKEEVSSGGVSSFNPNQLRDRFFSLVHPVRVAFAQFFYFLF
jgi:hypothetical protein